jgi:hypothetical protein
MCNRYVYRSFVIILRYSNASAYEFSLIRDAQINIYFSNYEPIFAYPRSSSCKLIVVSVGMMISGATAQTGPWPPLRVS